MSREDFTVDALFGMPGVSGEPGCLEIYHKGQPDERFLDWNSEATYQVWLRGYNSKALAVRDKLKSHDNFSVYADIGCIDPIQPIRGLYDEWQESGFIPKRPGD